MGGDGDLGFDEDFIRIYMAFTRPGYVKIAIFHSWPSGNSCFTQLHSMVICHSYVSLPRGYMTFMGFL